MTGLKHALIAVILTAATIGTNAQGLKGDFEHWDSTGTDFFRDYSPAGWMNVNNMNCHLENKPWAVTRTTDAHSGSYAIQLKNVALSFNNAAMLMSSASADPSASPRIGVSARHTKIEGYYKYTSPAADTFRVTVVMIKGENFIGFAEYIQTAQKDQFTKFSAPIIYSAAASQVPDSAMIMIAAGSNDQFVEGSTLIIDDLSFNLSQGLNEQKTLDAEVSIWPNPAAEETNLSIKGNLTGDVNVELINLLGQTLKTTTVKTTGREAQATLSLSGMPLGILFIKVSDENGSKGFRIVHQ